MKKTKISLTTTLVGIFLYLGCASHPISHNKDAPLTPKELKPSSKILVLTYMSNRESVARVELLGVTNIYILNITDTDTLASHIPKALKDYVNAKPLPNSVLDASPTYKSLDAKYKDYSAFHNLNKGMLIFDKDDIPLVSQIAQETKADAVVLLKLNFKMEDMAGGRTTLTVVVLDDQGQTIYSNENSLEFNYSNISNDPIDLGVGDVIGALTLQIRHPKSQGLQPIIVDDARTLVNKFFRQFSDHFKISKKKK